MGVAFKQPVIILHVSFRAISTCPVCLERPHEEQANSAVEKQRVNAVVCFVLMTCLIAPSPVELQYLIDICANYGFENDILFNRSKSVYMVVKPSGRNVSTPLMF